MNGRVSPPTLIGRRQELATLVESALNPPALVIVEGEGGVGKTRLVAELLATIAVGNRRCLLGRCHPLGQPLPLAPVIEALRSLGPSISVPPPLADLLVPWSPATNGQGGAAIGSSTDALGRVHFLFLGVLDLLRSLGPTLLVLDDMHFSDELTREFVRFLVPQLPSDLSLVLTYRPEDLDPSARLLSLPASCSSLASVTRVEVLPLTLDETALFVESALGAGPASPEFVRHIHRRSAGVSFLVEELLGQFRDRPDIVAGGAWIDDLKDVRRVPALVGDLVVERVSRLGPDARSIIDAAAVVGSFADQSVLTKVSGLSAARAATALSEALAAAVLVDRSGEYGFRHPLACEAVYSAIPGPVRRLYHHRAARALDAVLPAAALARHYRLGGDRSQWLRHAEMAADQAVGMGDDPAAAHILLPAVETRETSGPERVRLAFKLARVAARSSARLEDTVTALGLVIEQETLSPGVRGELRLFRGGLAQRLGNALEGRAELERAVSELRRRPALQARAMAWLARPDVYHVPLEAHLDWMDRAIEVAARVDDPRAHAEVQQDKAQLLILTGDSRRYQVAQELPWDSTSPALDSILTWIAITLSGAYCRTGDYLLSAFWLRHAQHRAAQLVPGGGPYADALVTTRLLLNWATGEWEGLEDRARRHALHIGDIPRDAVTAIRVGAFLALARGDVGRASRELTAFFDLASGAGVGPALMDAGAALARLELERGNVHAAVAEAEKWLQVVEAKGIWVWAAELAPVAVEALLAADRKGAAEDLVDRFAAGMSDRRTPLADCALIACRAVLAEGSGRSVDAIKFWARARRSLARLPRPYEAARAQARLGLCQLELGRPEGETSLQVALATFQRLGASGDAGRVRDAMKQHSLKPPHTGGRRSYGDSLSPREGEVVRFASEGLSNAAIAKVLGLSSKTVEHHVASAMRKLGVTSRRGFPIDDAESGTAESLHETTKLATQNWGIPPY